MISTGEISFAWTFWTAALAMVVLIVTAVLGVIACRRSHWKRSTVMLETLRLAIVGYGLVLLGGPEWVEQFRPDSKPVVAVLWDDSGSMRTRDVVDDSSPLAKSRGEVIEKLTGRDVWQPLTQRADVVIEPFAGTPPEVPPVQTIVNSVVNSAENEPERPAGTDLSKPLLDAIGKHESLLGVVVVSDGDWNQGDAPVKAAAKLRSLGVPVFVLPVGSETKLPDIDVVSFDVPTFAVAGKTVRLPLSIDSSMPRDQMATITIASTTGESIQKEIRIAAMGRTNESIDWKPVEQGETTLTLTVPGVPGEVREDNNQLSAAMAVREEKLKVLVIESLPRWEYRYLRNALSRDPGVEVSCLLFHPGMDRRGGGNSDYIDAFPPTKEALAAYDVVFLGDVGLDGDQLTIEQCEWLHGLVQQQASGLVFLPGWRGDQFTLLDTPLAELMPVMLDASQPGGWGSRTAQHFELTSAGRDSLLTKLADTADENLAVWSDLPGFQWYAPVASAKPGTETLAVHQEISNEFGRLPLLVTRTFGAGKVLFMGTDGAWRWRKGVEDLYHYRFWGQVVRWMAYRRNMARGETMRLYYSPEQPDVRQTILATANVMDAAGEPLAAGDVTLQIRPPSGRTQTVRFESTGEAWGAFAGRFSSDEPGEHQLTLFCKQTGDSLETKLLVRGLPLEQIGKPARPDVLVELARLTGGQSLPIDQAGKIVEYLTAMPDPPPSIRRVALWSHPAVAGGLIVLLSLFWISRKALGLI